MTRMTEGDLEISFPDWADVKKFDSAESHGLTHCMKSVDFIVEIDQDAIFIEFKDPKHPNAAEESNQQFIDSFRSYNLNE